MLKAPMKTFMMMMMMMIMICTKHDEILVHVHFPTKKKTLLPWCLTITFMMEGIHAFNEKCYPRTFGWGKSTLFEKKNCNFAFHDLNITFALSKSCQMLWSYTQTYLLNVSFPAYGYWVLPQCQRQDNVCTPNKQVCHGKTKNKVSWWWIILLLK